MKCPLCNLEMRIKRSRYVTENDDTPTKQTRLYVVQDMSCMNRDCENYDKIVDTVRNEIPLG